MKSEKCILHRGPFHISGLIDEDPDMVQDAIHKERDWFASAGFEVFRHKSVTEASSAFVAEYPFRQFSDPRRPGFS